MQWLSAKWKWIVTGIAVVVVMLVAFLTGKGVTKDDVQAALALRGIRKASKDAADAETKAKALNKTAEDLSKEYLAEEVRKEAEKAKANALSSTGKLIELRRRKLIK